MKECLDMMSIRGLECSCENDGFYNDGEKCSDIDECQDQTDQCDLHAQCINTSGSYNCTCLAGEYDLSLLVSARAKGYFRKRFLEHSVQADLNQYLSECFKSGFKNSLGFSELWHFSDLD